MVPSYTLPLQHPQQPDGSRLASAHVPFYLALQVMSDAWMALLHELTGDVLTPLDLAVVKVDAVFRREVFVGEAQFEPSLQRVGSSSLTFDVHLVQDGEPAGRLTIVLARVDAVRKTSVPLTDEQRALLTPAVAPA